VSQVGQLPMAGPRPERVAERPHHVASEELIAHLAGAGHACGAAADYMNAVIAQAVEAKAKVGVATPLANGQMGVNVQVDQTAILGEPTHRRVLERLHRAHSHDRPEDNYPLTLHRWEGSDDG